MKKFTGKKKLRAGRIFHLLLIIAKKIYFQSVALAVISTHIYIGLHFKKNWSIFFVQGIFGTFCGISKS